MRPALFVDKDGTLVENVPYNVDPSRIRFTPGALEGLRRLHVHGFVVVLVTNQAGVALGHFDERALWRLEEALTQKLSAAGISLAGMYWCPHHPQAAVARYARHCQCRKPLPGLLHGAARGLDLDLDASWLVGDILDDIEAGRRAGCRTVLLDNGNETQWELSPLRRPHLVVPDLSRAADAILDAVAATAS